MKARDIRRHSQHALARAKLNQRSGKLFLQLIGGKIHIDAAYSTEKTHAVIFSPPSRTWQIMPAHVFDTLKSIGLRDARPVI
jgi:hypothetical protein